MYLKELGIRHEAKDIISRVTHKDYDNHRIDYNPDISAREYQKLLQIFSLERKKKFRYNPQQDSWNIESHDWHHRVGDVLSYMLAPSADLENILLRQKISKFFVDVVNSEEKRINNILYLVLKHHKKITDSESYDITQIAPKFSNVVQGLSLLEQELGGEEMEIFLRPIRGFLNRFGDESEIVDHAFAFSAQGRFFLDYDGHFNVTQGVAEIGEDAIELGVFKKKPDGYDKKSYYYLSEDKDAKDMLSFLYRTIPVVNLLGSFYYGALAFKYLKKYDYPASFIDFNDDGMFELVKGFPIGTDLSHSRDIGYVNLKFDKDNNKILLYGPHSGGKSELLKNVGVSTIVGLTMGWLPADYANIPLTQDIITSVSKKKKKGRGSMESEMIEVDKIIKNIGPKDMTLIDEFFDTAKPEITQYIEGRYLDMLEEKQGPVLIVNHRARQINSTGYRILSPELKEEIDDSEEEPRKMLLPTYQFVEEPTSPEIMRRNALELWEAHKLAAKRNLDRWG